ncbi:inositol monophosphatase family protein [uncultured Rikenella sp.]|uniref:inositol monophosphatase family protein n=1 Tax=uncultured Rikenella sp. TaxID=368003 RepID=UPI0026138A28|nr:inositol monophosphatase family protein [uncultured Rikenella sp.]
MFTFEEFSDFVRSLTPTIRETVGKYIGHVRVEYKSDRSPVTLADKEIEQYIVSQIETRFPDGTIVGEESGTHPATSPDTGSQIEWIIDPIDGTKSFIHGVPLFATLIGVMVGGKAVYGAIYNPLLDDLIVGDNRVALWNGVPTRMRDCGSLAEATLLTTDLLDIELHRNLPSFLELARECRLLRTWGDAYGYCLLATGRADILVDPIMNRWDIAALIPVIRGAGGTITDYYGGEPETGDSIIASAPALHETAIAMLNK